MRSSFAADEPPGHVDCLINNLNDAVAWGLFPILFSTHHLSPTLIGLLGALYPASRALRSLVLAPGVENMGTITELASGQVTEATV